MRLPLHKVLLFLHDVLVLIAAIVLANLEYSNYSSYFEVGYFSTDLILGYILVIVTVLITFNEYDLYKYEVILNKTRQFTSLQKSLFISLLALVFCSFIFKFAELSSSRVLLGLIYLNAALMFCITRVMLIPDIFFALVRNRLIDRNLLIVGSGRLSTDRTEMLTDHHSYFNIVGIVEDGESHIGESVNGIPVLGNLDQLESITTDHKIHDILVASDCSNHDRLHEIIESCKKSNRTVHIVSELYDIATRKIRIEEIGKVSAFRYIPPQPGGHLFYPIAKRVFDIILSLLVIFVLLPIWLLIAALIKITSSGPIFYRAKAIGIHGKSFIMYKFRSMKVDAPTVLHEDLVRKMIRENGATTKLSGDPRITSIGKLLRHLSLDEFPQLLNVLKGEMSLVGPRPCLPYEFDEMKEWQKQRCDIKPGMTGIWQIKGRGEVLFNEQIVLDLYYKEHRSLWMDLEIMFNTIPVILFGRGGA